MKKTGIFFHYQQGERLKDFPQALAGIIEKKNVIYYDALYESPPDSDFDIRPVDLDTLFCVHSRDMIHRLLHSPEFDGALYSASGTVAAAERIFQNRITE